MTISRTSRDKKKQLGQFMTPPDMCKRIVDKYNFKISDKVLEPSFGCGNFIIPIIDKFLELYDGTIEEKLTLILNNNIYGVELDPDMYKSTLDRIKTTYGFIPQTHNLVEFDYLMKIFDVDFNYIIGNPPFGGTINPEYDKELEKKFGKRNDIKIKKETYSFFMIKSVENLKSDGKLIFISSDTFLTIKTMTGLRKFLFENGFNSIERIEYFSEETNYPMVILTHNKGIKKNHILLDNIEIYEEDMLLTDNFSWFIPKKYVDYFRCEKLNNYIIGSGGMTVGKNEYFLREITDDTIIEKYDFVFYDDPITLENEISKAKLNKIGDKKTEDIKQQELRGETKRNVKIVEKEPVIISLPNDDYCFYNKASNKILYAKPETVVYWKDDGDAVYTYKKNGNWYLNGVGGLPFFKKEGITWQLISSSIKARYLPTGYILDNSSPIIILKDDIKRRELFFILGWLLTSKANELLKNVLNHTKNIQSKDIERLPYPSWVSEEDKTKAIEYIQNNIKKIYKDVKLDDYFSETLEKFYKMT